MAIPSSRWLAISLVASVFTSGPAKAEAGDPDALILPTDPRFNVFELSNSAGDRTYSSPVGTVVLSFASKDSRYCRMARFPSDRNFVLACREERGWKIEATSSLTPSEATNPTTFGGGNMQEVGNAIEALRVHG